MLEAVIEYASLSGRGAVAKNLLGDRFNRFEVGGGKVGCCFFSCRQWAGGQGEGGSEEGESAAMLNLRDYFGRTEVYGRDWVLLDKHRLSTCSVCSVRVGSDFGC